VTRRAVREGAARTRRVGLVVATLALLAGGATIAAPPVPVELVAVVHLHTTLSDGAAAPRDLARAARAAGVDALVITDHYLERVEYAPWPIGNAIGVSMSRPSVLSGGLDRYLRTLSEAETDVPGVLVLPGLEVSPYARWTGSLLARSLALEGWHRHMLVIGVEDVRALGALPVAGNRSGGRYGVWSLLFLAPAAVIVWSLSRMRRPAERAIRVGRFVLRRRRTPFAHGLAAAASLGVLAVGFPWRVEGWSAVGPDPGDAPFRHLEDYVRGLGGLTSWAHPEAADAKEFLGVRMTTSPYADLVPRTDADLFGALPEGVKTLLPPGGLWDRALREHLQGRRRSVPYALAECDEHRAAGQADLRSLQTVCSVTERSHRGLVEALGAGRCYARWTPEGRPPLRLSAWAVERPGEPTAGSGTVLPVVGPLVVRLGVAGGDGHEVTARLVRRGEVIWSARLAPPFEREVADAPAGATYYRLDVEGAYPYRLIGNPIFVGAPGGTREGA